MPLTYIVDERFEDLLKDQAAAQKRLADVFPHLCNDLMMLTGKPVRLVWDPSIETASTDCVANVAISPMFFLDDELVPIGFGSAYHEAGHIRFSPYGSELLERAHRLGGEMLKHVVNLIVDRKDDIFNAEHAPGFADVLRRRMAYIATMSRHEMMRRRYPDMSRADIMKTLRNVRPHDRWEDFFFACKWHKRPRDERVARCMKLITRAQLLDASPDKLLNLAERIVKTLGPMDTPAKREGEKRFIYLCVLARGVELGMRMVGRGDADLSAIMAQVAAGHVAMLRSHQMKKLEQLLARSGVVVAGPTSVGRHAGVQVKHCPQKDTYRPRYEQYKMRIRHYVDTLKRKLRALDNPSEYLIHGQDEGELDLSEVARVAMGFDGHHMEVVVDRDIDAEIHLALDTSASMTGEKLERAKEIATLFSEAMIEHRRVLDGYVWAFNDQAVFECGPVCDTNAFVSMTVGSGNSDSHMIAAVGDRLAKSKRRRKLLIVICDDGPDDVPMVKRMTRELQARGVITIHMLVGVHATPEIYPIELLYVSMDELLDKFGDTLLSLIKTIR